MKSLKFSISTLFIFVFTSFLQLNTTDAFWIGRGSCSFYNGEVVEGVGSKGGDKPQGVNVACIVHKEKVFSDGLNNVEACPAPDNQGWTRYGLPAKPKNTDVCNICTEPTRTLYEDVGGSYDEDGNYTPNMQPYTETQRICTMISPTDRSVLNGSLFTAAAFGKIYTKNNECTKSTVPDTSIQVFKVDSNTSMWDAIAPTCERSMMGLVKNGPYYDNDYLTGVINSRGTDGTIYFANNPDQDYGGGWTNLDLMGRWNCSDGDSGCKNNGNSIIGGPLWHYQSSYSPSPEEVTDTVDNYDGATCDSRVVKPTSIKRTCQYILDQKYIDASELSIIKAKGLHSLSAEQPSDADYAEAVSKMPTAPLGGNPATPGFVQMVRNLEKISYANFGGDYHRLYELIPNSCVYKPIYGGDPNSIHPPLIDKIMPTVNFEFSGKNLIDNNGNILDNTQTFLAGKQTFHLRFEDAKESTYIKNPKSNWIHWNGISGLDTVHFTLKRIKTHDDKDVDDMIFDSYRDTSFTHEGNHDGWLPYNQTGAIHDIAHYAEFDGALEDYSGIEKTGLYEFEYSISDYAGNLNTGKVRFRVYPNTIDPSKTSFQKIDPDDLKIEYEMSGAVTNVWKNPLPSIGKYYANAKDTHEYRISIFDKYKNPAYSRNVSELKLNDTSPSQIPLDVLNANSPSAIFVSNTLSNLVSEAVTDMSGSFSIFTTSYRPGIFKEKYNFTTCTWGDDYKEISPCGIRNNVPNTPASAETGTFLHIFTGAIDLYIGNRIDLGTKNRVRVDSYTTTNKNPNISSFTLENFMESIRADSPGFNITFTGSYLGTRGAPYYLSDKFALSNFIPEQISSYQNVNIIKIYSAPLLNLDISGVGGKKTTRYYLTSNEEDFGSGISYGTGQLNRIYVEGNKSSKGKEGYVNNVKNVASMNSADVRNLIRKNVGILTRNRVPGTSLLSSDGIVNRVKYLKGDVTLSTLTDIDKWDTLIIERGNLLIDTDFNTEKKRKGIIVLGEADDVGHISITPNVMYIGATIFAENSIKSVDTTGAEIANSNSERALLLSNQLVFFGGVYSKNTIGGAVRAGSNQEYLIPWNDTTDSLDTAVKYDLAFLRMNNFGARTSPLFNEVSPEKSLNAGRAEFIVILYDERNLSDPLPGFNIDKK